MIRSALGLLAVVLAMQPARAGDADGFAWRALPEAIEEASTTQQPVLVYVQAAWCGPCRAMERDVFPEVGPLLGRFALARLDFDDHDTLAPPGSGERSPSDLARDLGAEATPSFILLDSHGVPIIRAAGYQPAREFALLLAYVVSGAYRHASMEDYVRQIAIPDMAERGGP